MVDISIQELEKYYDEDHVILDKLSFDVQAGERVGLLGRNGAGKTTLFRILSGELGYEGGTVSTPRQKRLGLLSQIPNVPEDWTAEDVLRSAFSELDRMWREMKRLEQRMAEDSSDPVLKQYAGLMERFEAAGGYETEQEIARVCNGLGIPPAMRSQAFRDLSGGEQTRVNLARLILEKTDILLLDEPTNHLDLNAIVWLENFLLKFKGTVLVISHDRYFLDKVVLRIVELVDGKAEFYSGNYSFYVQEKEARRLEQLEKYEQEQRKIQQLEQIAERMHGWAQRNAKLHRRAFAIEKRIERISRTDRPRREETMKTRFKEVSFKGEEVVKARGLAKSYGEKRLFCDLDLDILNGEHVAFVGDNGSGKTTLLSILTGTLPPDEGWRRLGPAIKAAVMPQKIEFAHPERTLLETVLHALNCSTQTARNRLGAFQFRGEDVFKQVRDLSGGERSRLWLCTIMAEGINLLVLDEPTNHLDIDSREWIEQAVEEFSGTLLFVSHDRYFVNRFATRILEFKDGSIYDFRGTYEEFLAFQEREERVEEYRRIQERKQPKAQKPRRTDDGKRRQKQIDGLELKIQRLEAENESLAREMEAAAQDFQRLNELLERQTALEEELNGLYEEWGQLVESQE